MVVSRAGNIVQSFRRRKECLINGLIDFRSCLNGLLNLYLLLPAKCVNLQARHPVQGITQMCFNLISTMIIPGIKFNLIPCGFKNH